MNYLSLAVIALASYLPIVQNDISDPDLMDFDQMAMEVNALRSERRVEDALQLVEEQVRLIDDPESFETALRRSLALSVCGWIKDAECFRRQRDLMFASAPAYAHYFTVLRAFDGAPRQSAFESVTWLLANNLQTMPYLSVSSLLDIVDHLREQQDLLAARSLLEQVVETDIMSAIAVSEQEALYENLARLYVETGDSENAFDILIKHVGSFDQRIFVQRLAVYDTLRDRLVEQGYYDQSDMRSQTVDLMASAVRSEDALNWNSWASIRLDSLFFMLSQHEMGAAKALLDQSLALFPEHETSSYEYGFLYEARALLYEQAGNIDAAEAVYTDLLSSGPDAWADFTSQAINYAAFLWRHRRFEEALTTANQVFENNQGSLSDSGEVWVRTLLICSHIGVNPAYDAADDISALRALRRENHQAFALSLLCVGDAESIAQDYIDRLSGVTDWELAFWALLPEENKAYPDTELDVMRTRVQVITLRADVQDALKRHGRIAVYPGRHIYWGTF